MRKKKEKAEIQESPISVSPAPKKKKHTGLTVFLILLILVIAAAVAFYLYQREKPKEAVREFLGYVQTLDFDGMTSMLQSEDLSALDSTDVRDTALAEFFAVMNEKMTYKIVKTHFEIQNGTASVTARIRYLNGSELYKDAISEFARQIVSAAFAGTEMSEEEMHQKLADLLLEKSASMEEQYLVTEITYPLVQNNGAWKIVTMNDETINVMSANFHSIEAEIDETLAGAAAGSETDTVPTASNSDVIDMTTEKFTIHYTQFRVSTDFGGEPCILVYYDYTNNSSSPSSAMVDVNLQAYQNDALCQAALPETTEEALDQYMSEVQPGATVNVCQAFSITDMSDVTLQAGEAYSFGGGQTTTQVLKLQ